MKCLKCGNDLEPGAKFCNKCGTTIPEETISNQVVTSVPPVQAEQPVINKPNNKKKILIIVGLILLEIVLLVGTGLIVYKVASKDNKEDCKTSSTLNKDSKEQEEAAAQEEADNKEEISVAGYDFSKIKLVGENDLGKKFELVKTIYDKEHKQLHVLLKNNTGFDTDSTLYLNYLDSTGTRIDRELTSFKTKKDTLVAVYLYCSPEEAFADLNLSISGNKVKSYYNIFDVKDSDLKVTKLDRELRVDYTNTFNEEMLINYSVIYYKNDEIVDFNWGFISDINAGSTGSSTIYFTYLNGFNYSNPNSSELFDRYEVIENLAYNYPTGDDY